MSDDAHFNSETASTTGLTPDSTPADTSEDASWNPAHRPDSNRRHTRTVSSASEVEFFDRYPDPSSENSKEPLAERMDELEEVPEIPQPSAKPHISVQTSTNHAALTDAATNVEESADGRGENVDSEPATAIEHILGKDGDDPELAVLQSDETAPEKELEHQLPVPSVEPIFISSPGTQTPVAHDVDLENELEKYQQQGKTYEHQGNVTEMEEAVDEAPSAPLLDDEEAPPTVEDAFEENHPIEPVQESSVMDDSGPAEHALPTAKAAMGHMNRSFTTNFTEDLAPAEEKEEESSDAPDNSGWPAAGDDRTFGELLDSDMSQALAEQEQKHVSNEELPAEPVSDAWGSAGDDDTFGELLGGTQPDSTQAHGSNTAEETSDATDMPTKEDATEEDLAAVFAAALDDDLLLEDDSKDLDPSVFFGDDDMGFLDDELLTDTAPTQVPAPILSPIASQPNPVGQTPRSTSGSQFPNQTHGRSAGTPSTGLYDVYNHGAPLPNRPAAQSAQSFVDKSKGGYQSPYDLPMEVVKPKQRLRQSTASGQAMSTPPLRSSSMSSQPGQPPLIRPPAAGTGIAGMTPPSSSSGPASSTTARSNSGFFEDLPIAPKTRPRPSGAYTPQAQGAPTPPPGQAPPSHMSRGPSAPPVRPPSIGQPAYEHLSQPERLPLLPDNSNAPTLDRMPSAPPPSQRYSPNHHPMPSQAQTRFSPAPPPAPSSQATNARYSPAPPAQAPSKKYAPAPAPAPGSAPGAGPAPPLQHARSFAPRTSSPLAHHGRPQPGQSGSPTKPHEGPFSPSLMSPDRGGIGHSESGTRAPSISSIASPPLRMSAHSPPTTMKTSRYSSSVSIEPSSLPAAPSAPTTQRTFMPHRRKFSKDISFAAPSDERAHDPLQRWKGHPVFRWGDSGSVVSSFPRQTPFYASGQGVPSIKCTPGAVTVQQAASVMPMDELDAKFPGPLPSKAKKKKEILAWMTSKIESLERLAEAVRMDFNIEPDLKKRTEEKLVLWRIMKIFVEHDGKLEGDEKIEQEIRAVLLPNLAEMSQVTELQSPIGFPAASVQPDPLDKNIVVQLRQALLEGQRERAVWLAEENKLWGHAMLIASTMGPEIWRQIIQSFVRSQVKTVGSDARSLAALYQVFAGNAEECVDELVPPSARAGFQMVSKTDGAISINPLEGLDQWQETLGLIAGNRTPTDGHSLLALGKMLSGYGRAEAAHTCFLFARMLSKHTGADDPEATFVLLGANHQKVEESFGNDLDSIMLTEIYEWAVSFSAQRAEYTPHLQPFKLIHAQELAAHGFEPKAQAYCDHIVTAYQSTTRPSPYYHQTFTQAVADLSAFLSQTPHSGHQGLLSKGAMNKVSSKTATWFTKFVSGDDDHNSNASAITGIGATGPFGGVNGNSPVISRQGSSADIYGSMANGGALPHSSTTMPQQPSSGPSKYAPSSGGHKYAPMSLSGFSTTSEQRPGTSGSQSYGAVFSPSSAFSAASNKAVSEYGAPFQPDSRRGSAQLSSSGYEPRQSIAETPNTYSYSPSLPQGSDVPTSGFHPTYGARDSVQADPDVNSTSGGGYEPPSASYGYEPPSGGYEPPSYQPYEPDAEPETEEAKAKPRKKGIMDDDDDDDILARASSVKSSTPAAASSNVSKSEADRIAEENFRKAAEADAARDNAKDGGKKGWLSGWFGGKKQEGMPQQQAGPVRAKLGEENSFYFDKELGKWVNKKDPKGAESAAAATPPPPKGPPSRNISGAAGGPPSGPPSRVVSGLGLAGMPRMPPTSVGSPPSVPGSGPPSRVGTPAAGSDAPPMPAAITALNGSGPPSQPPSRPSTSLSHASSIDDLLGGPPGPRKGGTVKSKKKGGRYVDVMAK